LKASDLYYDEMTTATYKELLRVGGWFNRFAGYHPVIVGGWAVFHYNPKGLGSRASFAKAFRVSACFR